MSHVDVRDEAEWVRVDTEHRQRCLFQSDDSTVHKGMAQRNGVANVYAKVRSSHLRQIQPLPVAIEDSLCE
jgi:hypothetical protein